MMKIRRKLFININRLTQILSLVLVLQSKQKREKEIKGVSDFITAVNSSFITEKTLINAEEFRGKQYCLTSCFLKNN